MDSMFYDCQDLKYVHFKKSPNLNSVFSLEDAFEYCSKLKEIHIDSLKLFTWKILVDVSYMDDTDYDEINERNTISTYFFNDTFDECDSLKGVTFGSGNQEEFKNYQFIANNFYYDGRRHTTKISQKFSIYLPNK